VAARDTGVAQVQDCPLGTYKDEPNLVSAAQCTECPANSFCPSPTMIWTCPPGTVSAARSTSQLQCTCQAGFTCNYRKVVNAVVTLQMSAADFLGNAAVRDAFKNAVAAAAKTTADKVTIVKVVSSGGGGGGARRRMLSVGGGEMASHVAVEIEGGEGKKLEEDLGAHLRMAGLSSGGAPVWIEPHEVRVRPAV